MELIRGDLSSSLGAALGNALLFDTKHLFHPHVDINEILIDKSRINRAKSKVKVISEVRQLEGKTHAICVGVDSKIDEKTLDYKATEDDIGNNIKKKVAGSQHHLIITYESGICSGEYLSHKTLSMTALLVKLWLSMSTMLWRSSTVWKALEQYWLTTLLSPQARCRPSATGGGGHSGAVPPK